MINLSIDLNKIDKSRIKEHANGAKYYNITVDELQTPDKYGNTHCVYTTPTKEEREARAKKSYLGNGRQPKFNGQKQANNSAAVQNTPQANANADDLPF
jgi:hypothetical protein